MKSIIMWIAIFAPWIDYTLKHILHATNILNYWDEVFLLFTSIAAIYYLLKSNPVSRVVILTFSMFFSVAIISAAINNVGIYPMIDFTIRSILPFSLFIIMSADNKPDKRSLVFPLGLFLMSISLMGIFQVIMKIPIPNTWVSRYLDNGIKYRAFSIFFSPNITGLFIVYLLPLFIFLSYFALKKKANTMLETILLSTCVIIGSVALLLTFSRGAWISIIVALFLTSLLIDFKFGISSPILGIISILLVPPLRHRLTSLFTKKYFVISSKGGRVYEWSIAIFHWKEQGVLLGSGPGTFGSRTAWNLGISKFLIDMSYLRILVELGILGLITYVTHLVSIAWSLFYSLPSSRSKEDFYITLGILAGVIGFIVAANFENFADYSYFLMLLYTTSAITIGGNKNR